MLPVAAGAALGYLDDTRADLPDKAADSQAAQSAPLPGSSPETSETKRKNRRYQRDFMVTYRRFLREKLLPEP